MIKLRDDIVFEYPQSRIRECEGLEIREQRKIKKAVRKVKSVGNRFKKLSEYFIKPTVSISKECQHRRTVPFYDMPSEKVWIRCLDCNKILGNFSPLKHEKKMNKDPRNVILLESCRRKRN